MKQLILFGLAIIGLVAATPEFENIEQLKAHIEALEADRKAVTAVYQRFLAIAEDVRLSAQEAETALAAALDDLRGAVGREPRYAEALITALDGVIAEVQKEQRNARWTRLKWGVAGLAFAGAAYFVVTQQAAMRAEYDAAIDAIRAWGGKVNVTHTRLYDAKRIKVDIEIIAPPAIMYLLESNAAYIKAHCASMDEYWIEYICKQVFFAGAGVLAACGGLYGVGTGLFGWDTEKQEQCTAKQKIERLQWIRNCMAQVQPC